MPVHLLFLYTPKTDKLAVGLYIFNSNQKWHTFCNVLYIE